MKRKHLGLYGEKIAAAYLLKNNYRVLDSNFHSRFGEIDIIAKQEKSYVFVEIKTRRSTVYGEPEEALNKQKLTKIYRTIFHYFEQKNISSKNIHWRIDLIAIKLGQDLRVETLKHYQNIFL